MAGVQTISTAAWHSVPGSHNAGSGNRPVDGATAAAAAPGGTGSAVRAATRAHLHFSEMQNICLPDALRMLKLEFRVEDNLRVAP